MSILSVATNDAKDGNESIRFFAPEDGIISDCNDLYNPSLFTVMRGPSLSVGVTENKTQHWIGSIQVVDNQLTIENHGGQDVPLNIEFDGNGPQWAVSNGIILSAGQVTNVSVTPPESGISFSWLELNDEEVILHLVNHEV